MPFTCGHYKTQQSGSHVYCMTCGEAVKNEPTYECYANSWCTVTEHIFRSWSGKRRLNGEEYHGPVYYLGTDEVARA